MTPSADAYPLSIATLAERRSALVVRIHAARGETAAIGRLVAADLEATENTRRTLLTGWKVAKTALLAGGVIWSLKAASTVGRGSRLLSVVFSALSTVRALRRIGTLFTPLVPPTGRQG